MFARVRGRIYHRLRLRRLNSPPESVTMYQLFRLLLLDPHMGCGDSTVSLVSAPEMLTWKVGV